MKRTNHSRREIRVSAAPQRFEIRKLDDGSRSISGTAVVFNSLSEKFDGWVERISPGAFTQSLRSNPDVIILYQHDMSQPLGRVSSGTARVWQNDNGLQFTCTLPDTSWARDLIALLERGDVSQMSFGFAVPPGGDTWDIQPDGTMLRTVNQAILYECSVVTVPAYSATSVDLRNAPAHIREQIKANRRDLEDEDDDDIDNDLEDLDCDCRCAECRNGDCETCSNELCDDDDCAECPIQTRTAHVALLMRRLR